MTREEALRELREDCQNLDPEAAHARADRVLIDLLTCLGYDDVVAGWDKVHKWYT